MDLSQSNMEKKGEMENKIFWKGVEKMTDSWHLMHIGKECLCLKLKGRAAFLASPPERKDVMQTCTKGHGSLTGLGLLPTRQTLRGSNCLFFKEKACHLLFLDPMPTDSSLEVQTTPCAAP